MIDITDIQWNLRAAKYSQKVEHGRLADQQKPKPVSRISGPCSSEFDDMTSDFSPILRL
jgi:hypothetical protein